MNISAKLFIFTALLSMFVAGCGLPASKSTEASASPTAVPTQTMTPHPVATFTEFVPPPSPTSEFAPFCEAGDFSSLPQCRFPSMTESSTFCSKKNPYTIILMSEGMDFEVLTEEFRCTASGEKDGMQILTCTGPMASRFEVEACDPSCVIPTVQALTEKCPQGYNFNGLLGCCTQEIQMLNRNCMTFEFETTSCLVDCSVYTTETLCGKNSYACLWDVQNEICYARK